MSGFKRMQSKVFWGHMAAQDLDNRPLLHGNRAGSSSGVFKNSYCNFGRDSDTDNASDTSPREINLINESITAIQMQGVVEEGGEVEFQMSDDTNQSKNLNEAASIPKESNNIVDSEVTAKALDKCRSSSPLSESHGSLDSGFSDSDRSKSPGINNDGTPKRQRRRTRRSRDRPSVNPRLNALWKKDEIPPNPVHTSTPNRGFTLARSRQSLIFNDEVIRILKNDFENSRKIEEEKEDSPIQQTIHQEEEECLGDFLYVNEPPEDEIPTSSSTSRGSTPSLSGYWYSRLSNELSKSSSRSKERSLEAVFEDRSQGSVTMWLKYLAEDCEQECCVTLQSKALPKRNRNTKKTTEESQTRDLRILTTSATAAATELLVRADGFSKHITDVIYKFSHLESGRSEGELLRSIEDEAFSILAELSCPPPRRIHEGSLRSILSQLESLKNIVNCALDTRLDIYIERVVRGLEEAPNEFGSAARGALAALTALGLAGSRAGTSIARCSGVRALLTLLISSGRLSSDLRASTLRALSSICCCSLAIDHFVKEGGPEILVDLLASKRAPEREKMEAIALVVQITAPWTEALGLRDLEPFAHILVDTLTFLAEETSCMQTLLLSAAALNNLADSYKCIYGIVQCDTVKKLLRCVKKSTGVNIWLMEQVAALIGKLAKYPEVRKHLASSRASVALVCFLRMAPPGLEIAYQRLAITAATALTRLCVDPEIAQQVVAVGGADCLPNLKVEDIDDDDDQLGLLKYTKSLRLACRKAAKHIDDAKACDYSI